MDETQKRKLTAKEILERSKNIGFIVAIIFVSLFIIYFASVYFYTREKNLAENPLATSTIEDESGFMGNLLPVFNVSDSTDTPDVDNGLLKNFSNVNPDDLSGDNASPNDNSKVIRIEDRPILGYVVFDKPISIKSYIKEVPKICTEKIEPVVQREDKSTAVLNFQNTLKSIPGFDTTPITGILDKETRDKIYVFQDKYADILYKTKTDKTPTRVIDKETAHFINLLCGIDSENKDDFVMVPTLRYSLKETRQIFDYNTASKEKFQVDGKLASGTQDVLFSMDGNLAVYRSEKVGVIDSIIYNIRNRSLTHLEPNITTLDFSPKGILYYGVPGTFGISIKKYNPLTNTASQVATLPLNDWNLSVLDETHIGLNNKPTAFADGIYISIDTSTGKIRQLGGPLLGLSVQKTDNPDFSLLSIGGKGTSKTLLLNNKTRNIGDFGIKTFADKCAKTIFADGVFCAVPKTLREEFIYPDDWYKGKTRTEDIIMYRTLSGTSTKVVSYLESRPFSIVNLSVNKKGIFFMDENTSGLYSIEF